MRNEGRERRERPIVTKRREAVTTSDEPDKRRDEPTDNKFKVLHGCSWRT